MMPKHSVAVLSYLAGNIFVLTYCVSTIFDIAKETS